MLLSNVYYSVANCFGLIFNDTCLFEKKSLASRHMFRRRYKMNLKRAPDVHEKITKLVTLVFKVVKRCLEQETL